MKVRASFLCAATLGVAILLALSSAHSAPPRLLPFQGRLTDANGTPVPDGAKVVQFRIYDAPTGGNAVWNGEVHKVTVNGGLVSTLLGSKADLSQIDFNQALYLEITVDANSDNQITAADPPLLPRQSVLPAVFAMEASQIAVRGPSGARVAGAGWEAVFDNGNPATGKIPGAKLANASVTTAQLAANAVTAAQLAPNAVTTAKLVDSAVTGDKVSDGSVALPDLGADVIARFAAIESRLAALETDKWTPLSDSLGELPFKQTTEASFDLPRTLPVGAKQILVFARVFSGSVLASARAAIMKIYTKEGDTKYSAWFYAFTYQQDAIGFNSSVFWLPLTSDRKLYAQGNTALPDTPNLGSEVYVIGYK